MKANHRGGGIGHLSRKYGLTIDSLLSVDMVLADGSYITASDQQKQDLFWAVRGGGGIFGVVISFTFRLHPVRTVMAGTLIANIPLGGKPEYGASAGDGKLYANVTDTSEVVEIDAKTATVVRRWSTAPRKQPVSMALDRAHHRLFSGCRSGVMAVSDYQVGKVVATVPHSMRPPATRLPRMRTARSPRVHRFREVWAGARRGAWQGQGTGAASV